VKKLKSKQDIFTIPKGVEHWLYNTSDNEPIHAVGLYIGSGSVEETGYVYLGDVTEDDITL
jgi:mannose-6-phosphate isomerase-like protein (cupin superfamily)